MAADEARALGDRAAERSSSSRRPRRWASIPRRARPDRVPQRSDRGRHEREIRAFDRFRERARRGIDRARSAATRAGPHRHPSPRLRNAHALRGQADGGPDQPRADQSKPLRRHALRVELGRAHELGEAEGEVERLARVQPRIAERHVPRGKLLLEDGFGAAEALGHVLARELEVDAAPARPARRGTQRRSPRSRP